MKGFDNSTYLLMYCISNAAALLILYAAWKQPRLARLILFLVFGWASWINLTTALRRPGVYLEYGDLSLLKIYRQFISGWFSRHVEEVVVFIAVCQALIAILLLLKGWLMRVGAAAAIVFLLAIAPLGVGSAFPFSLLVAAALCRILRDPAKDYLWINPTYNYSN